MMRKLVFSQQGDQLVNESISHGVKLIAAVDIHDRYCLFYARRRMKSDGREEKTRCVFFQFFPLSFFLQLFALIINT